MPRFLDVSAFNGFVPPALVVREVGDTTIPDGFPADGLVFSKQPAVVRKWDGIGIPDGTEMSTSVAGELDNAFTFVEAASGGAVSYTGGSIGMVNAAGARYVVWDGLAGDGEATRCYMRVTAYPASSTTIVRGADSGLAQLWGMSITSSGNVGLRNSAGSAVWTAGSALTLNKTYRFEITVDGGGYVTLSYYDLAGNLIGSSGSLNCGYGSTVVDAFLYGHLSSAAWGPSYWSHIAVIDHPVEVGRYNAGVSY